MSLKDAQFRHKAAELEVKDLERGIKKNKASKVGIIILILIVLALLVVAVRVPVIILVPIAAVTGFAVVSVGMHKDKRYNPENLQVAKVDLMKAERHLAEEENIHYQNIIQEEWGI